MINNILDNVDNNYNIRCVIIVVHFIIDKEQAWTTLPPLQSQFHLCGKRPLVSELRERSSEKQSANASKRPDCSR